MKRGNTLDLVGLRPYTVSHAKPRIESRGDAWINWPPSNYEMESGIKPLACQDAPINTTIETGFSI